LAGKSYGAFLEEYMDQHPAAGPILDRNGTVLGEHRGLIYYTIGQRRGIGIAAREPLYVVALDASRNAVIVGSKKDLYHDRFTVRDVQWISGYAPREPVAVYAKIRYLHAAARAVITPGDDSQVRVCFDTPQLAITPGQSAVFYDIREWFVLGGGVIEAL
jgi:tRNA-specific 2-thiouridylase